MNDEARHALLGVFEAGTARGDQAAGGRVLRMRARCSDASDGAETMNGKGFPAGHPLMSEAGGGEPVDIDDAVVRGARVVVAGAGVFDAVAALAREAFDG